MVQQITDIQVLVKLIVIFTNSSYLTTLTKINGLNINNHWSTLMIMSYSTPIEFELKKNRNPLRFMTLCVDLLGKNDITFNVFVKLVLQNVCTKTLT